MIAKNNLAEHRAWLGERATDLLRFGRYAAFPDGAFGILD